MTKETRTARVVFYVTPSERRKLRIMAAERDVSVSDLMRQLVQSTLVNES